MNEPAAGTSFLMWALIIGGAAGLVGATVAAARARVEPPAAESERGLGPRGGGFGWIVIASLTYGILALAAALARPDGDGLRAGVVQLGSVFLAAALGAVSLGGRSAEDGRGSQLARVGLVVAWLSLLGLPPALGFHGKVLVYRSLLQAGWGWLAVVAMAGSVGALLPACQALAVPGRQSVSRSRAVLIVLLAAAVILLGLYPQAALSVAALRTGSG